MLLVVGCRCVSFLATGCRRLLLFGVGWCSLGLIVVARLLPWDVGCVLFVAVGCGRLVLRTVACHVWLPVVTGGCCVMPLR